MLPRIKKHPRAFLFQNTCHGKKLLDHPESISGIRFATFPEMMSWNLQNQGWIFEPILFGGWFEWMWQFFSNIRIWEGIRRLRQSKKYPILMEHRDFYDFQRSFNSGLFWLHHSMSFWAWNYFQIRLNRPPKHSRSTLIKRNVHDAMKSLFGSRSRGFGIRIYTPPQRISLGHRLYPWFHFNSQK